MQQNRDQGKSKHNPPHFLSALIVYNFFENKFEKEREEDTESDEKLVESSQSSRYFIWRYFLDNHWSYGAIKAYTDSLNDSDDEKDVWILYVQEDSGSKSYGVDDKYKLSKIEG